MASSTTDETTALLPENVASSVGQTIHNPNSAFEQPHDVENAVTQEETTPTLTIWTIVLVSLLGVFVANLDGSLIVATSQQIASEFNTLSNASWLISSFVLALCASQPLYGKLSDIFGRRGNLVAAYLFFAVGNFLCAIGQQFWHVVVGRMVSGIGGAGMTVLVSIIITDLVPMREVARWTSYVNIAATSGRACGGPVGGVLTDKVGWRYCFYAQVPTTMLGLLLILWKLPRRRNESTKSGHQFLQLRERLARVDLPGAICLVLAILGFLFALQFSTSDHALGYTVFPATLCIASAILFYIIETKWTKEPILPLFLFTHIDSVTTYLLAGFQMAAQFSIFFSVPIYYQIVTGSNVGQAGIHLSPAVIGNATAGLLSGYVVSKTGRYKWLTVAGNLVGCIGYLLVFIRWRGSINPAESLYIFFGGFASGTNISTNFIHLAASLGAGMIAVAGATLFLVQNLFLLIGIQLSTAVLHTTIRRELDNALEGVDDKSEIIKRAVNSIDTIRSLPPQTRKAVVEAYLNGLTYTYAMSLGIGVVGLTFALCLRQKTL